MGQQHLEELKDTGMYWEDADYRKFRTILFMQYNGLFNDIFPEGATPMSRTEYMQTIDERVNHALRLAEDFGMVIRGLTNKPISYNNIKRL